MNKTKTFIETKEYKRFAEFCDACVRYKYIGVCYGIPGVGKTVSARHYANWDYVNEQIIVPTYKEIGEIVTKDILLANTIFCTAPAERQTKISSHIHHCGVRIGLTKTTYLIEKEGKEDAYYLTDAYEGIDLIIVDEVDRLKLQHFEQLRDIYDQNDVAMVLIGMPGIEKRLSRYPQLYSRIGFAHEFDNLSKDETHHIIEYKWSDLGLDIKLEDFSDYEAITSIIKITKGNFRLLHRLFAQIHRILEINQLNTINVDVVEAARESLVIGL